MAMCDRSVIAMRLQWCVLSPRAKARSPGGPQIQPRRAVRTLLLAMLASLSRACVSSFGFAYAQCEVTFSRYKDRVFCSLVVTVLKYGR
eukprot:535461-Prymnesium_polylepis.1